MNSYEEERTEFRPRPRKASLFLFGVASFLMADVVQSLVTWVLELTLAWNSGWKRVVILDLPVLTDPSSPFYTSPPLESPWTYSAVIAAAFFLLLGAALVYIWPTRTSLASRLYIHISAIVFVLKGTIGTILARTELLSTGEIVSRAVALVLIALGAAILIAIQRSLFIVLQQFWDLDTWTERVALFASVELPGLILIGTIFWFNGFQAGTLAAAITIIPLFVTAAPYSPRTIYERVTTHSLARASILILLIAGSSIAASIWFFGSNLIELPRRAVTWASERGVAVQTHAEIFRQQLRDPEGKKLDDEPMIRWSNP